MSYVLVLAHVLGMPVEEFVVPLTSGGLGAGILLVLHRYLLSTIGRYRRGRY